MANRHRQQSEFCGCSTQRSTGLVVRSEHAQAIPYDLSQAAAFGTRAEESEHLAVHDEALHRPRGNGRRRAAVRSSVAVAGWSPLSARERARLESETGRDASDLRLQYDHAEGDVAFYAGEDEDGCRVYAVDGPNVRHVNVSALTDDDLAEGVRLLSAAPVRRPSGRTRIADHLDEHEDVSEHLDERAWIRLKGKLGGAGYLSKTARQRQEILAGCVDEHGYRSCLGSIQALERSGKLQARYGTTLAADREWLVRTYGSRSHAASAHAEEACWAADQRIAAQMRSESLEVARSCPPSGETRWIGAPTETGLRRHAETTSPVWRAAAERAQPLLARHGVKLWRQVGCGRFSCVWTLSGNRNAAEVARLSTDQSEAAAWGRALDRWADSWPDTLARVSCVSAVPAQGDYSLPQLYLILQERLLPLPPNAAEAIDALGAELRAASDPEGWWDWIVGRRSRAARQLLDAGNRGPFPADWLSQLAQLRARFSDELNVVLTNFSSRNFMLGKTEDGHPIVKLVDVGESLEPAWGGHSTGSGARIPDLREDLPARRKAAPRSKGWGKSR